MLWLAAAFAAGIAVSGSVPFGFGWMAAASGLFAVCGLIFAGRSIAGFFLLIAFASAGAAVYRAHSASITPDRVRSIYDSGQIESGDPVEITGTVRRGRETTPDGFFFRVDVDSIVHRDDHYPTSGTVRLFASVSGQEMSADYEQLNLKPGTRIRAACGLIREDGFRNPGGLSRKTVLEWQDLDASGTIRSPLLVDNLGDGRSGITSGVFTVRDHLIGKFRELFSPQAAGVLIASLLGNKYFLDAETAGIFREGGTFHILVISGLHITFIGGLLAWVVGLFTRRKGIQFAVVCSILWLYTIAVGAEVPVVRASLMFTVLWFSFVIHRTGSLANALGTCGLLLLAWRPNDLFTPSFQLTFVSVGAIVIAGFPLISTLRAIGEWTPSSDAPFPAGVPGWMKRLCETLYWNPKRWEIELSRTTWSAALFKSAYPKLSRPVQKLAAYLFEGILISLIVQIAMLPLVVHYFHRVTPVSVPMNLWVGLFIALESFASLFAVLSSYISGSLVLPFVRLTELFHWLLATVPGWFTDARWLSFRVPVYAGFKGWLYAAYFLLTAILAFSVFLWDPFILSPKGSGSFKKLKITTAALLIAFGGIIVSHPFSELRADGRLHVEFLDVGQGDSAFITFPNGETMLVDAGGRVSYRDEDDTFEPDLPSPGETVVSEFLWERGYSRIDRIVATHADADHIQGLSDVARNFSIGEAWFGRLNIDDGDTSRLVNILERDGVPIRPVSRGMRTEIGGVQVHVLSPPASGAEFWRENDASVVMLLEFGRHSFLLTGDAERLAETDILSSDMNLNADVLKVPHHGSRTSSTSEFVSAVTPRFAVIPVGRRSMFGHPHSEVVERWKSVGAEVFTTGESGTISFSTNGNDLSFNTFVRNSE